MVLKLFHVVRKLEFNQWMDFHLSTVMQINALANVFIHLHRQNTPPES